MSDQPSQVPQNGQAPPQAPPQPVQAPNNIIVPIQAFQLARREERRFNALGFMVHGNQPQPPRGPDALFQPVQPLQSISRPAEASRQPQLPEPLRECTPPGSRRRFQIMADTPSPEDSSANTQAPRPGKKDLTQQEMKFLAVVKGVIGNTWKHTTIYFRKAFPRWEGLGARDPLKDILKEAYRQLTQETEFNQYMADVEEGQATEVDMGEVQAFLDIVLSIGNPDVYPPYDPEEKENDSDEVLENTQG